jgi:protein-tyrosine kinase
MSIIEQALEKGRAAQQQRPKTRRASADSARTAERREQAAAIDPSSRILAQSMSVDPRGCRDNRVLLGDTADGDAAATAAYRILRTRLLHRARIENWTTIAVTSACANDGKTLTAINLALSMAREKSREIVLLDLDMRNPSVCRVLGVHPPYDLGVHLEKGEGERELFFSVGSDNLLIAGSDSPMQRASELLSSSRFDDLLGMIRTGTVNPVILIDLPPLLLTDDALVVAPKVDAVLVVACQGATGRADLSKALNLLSEFTIAGVVLNRADDAGPGYEYSYYQESPAQASAKDS